MSSQDKITLCNMVFRGRHGVHPAERELGQRFDIDVELIEALAGAIVRRLLAELTVTSVLVRVRKPQVPLNGILSFAAVEIQRRR